MLEVTGLECRYGKRTVLSGIDLRVEAGQTVALVGVNGAGKTTLLRALSGLLRPTQGSVRLEGKEISRLKPFEIVRLGMSHVPERRGIFANLSVLENLVLGTYQSNPTAGQWERVYTLFPLLRARGAQSAGTLSGGEQQMLALGRALLACPKLLLLDEPSLGLAPQLTRKIFDTIQAINQEGTTVLLVEQNAVAALRISRYAYVLETGRVCFEGASEVVAADAAIQKAYLGA